jgi:ligand-binding sensor domain-containing protein
VLDPRTGTVAHLRQSPDAAASLIDDRVYSLMEYPRGEMWIGTENGIDRWTFDGNRFTHFPFADGQSVLAGKQITAMTAQATARYGSPLMSRVFIA